VSCRNTGRCVQTRQGRVIHTRRNPSLTFFIQTTTTTTNNNNNDQIEDLHLVREEDTGKSRGFAFVKYEDAKSCVLAVDNFVGVKVRCVVGSTSGIELESNPGQPHHVSG
jgi:hypothetical protein